MNKINTITLQEAKNIKLFDRVEKKYVCTFNQLYSLIESIVYKYYVVEDSNKIIFDYHSIYFDTPSMIMFNAHENSIPHRQKIRIREYSNGDKFLEIKDKSAEGITKKSRIPVDSYELDGEKQWIDKNLMYDTAVLNKTLDIKYKRITLISFDKSERITIDIDICFKNYITGIKRNLNDTVVIEIKQSEEHISELENELLKRDINKAKFSKYHIGIKTTKED